MLITKAINFLLEREQLCIYYLPLAGKILNFPAPDIFQKNNFFSEKCSLISSIAASSGT